MQIFLNAVGLDTAPAVGAGVRSQEHLLLDQRGTGYFTVTWMMALSTL